MSRVRVCARCRKMNPAEGENCTDCGGSIHHAAVVEVEDQHPVVDRLQCPDCDVPMHSGRMFMHVPVVGWDWRMLTATVVFRLAGQRSETTVLEFGQKRGAVRCPRCGGVWIGIAPGR
jgi:hypothetical protein